MKPQSITIGLCASLCLFGGLSSQLLAQEIDLQLTQVASIIALDIKHAGDGSNRIFLAQQAGEVRVLKNGVVDEQPFLNITERVLIGSERGLLSIEFAPDFANSGVFYAWYTNRDGNMVLSRFQSDGQVADPNSEQILLDVFQPQSNHNGGRLQFGPNGMLWLGIGDGGGAGDPENFAQNNRTLLGKLIRIDVSGQTVGYTIPADNPFVSDPLVNSEIFATGLRNPWRISFDRQSNDLFIADVGQNRFEEINVVLAGDSGGQNFGWNIREGNSCFAGSCSSDGLTDPVFVYGHDSNGGCSVTGGQVYRGPDYPQLQGLYIYSDFCSGTLWGLQQVAGQWQNQVLLESGMSPLTFGEDERGSMYMATPEGIFLISDGEAILPSVLPFDGSISGTWIAPGLNDQGFFVTVGDDVNGAFVFIAWFTFDADGNDLWLVGNASISEADSTVSLQMQRLSGPVFGEQDASAVRDVVGTLILSTIDCDGLQAEFDFGALGSNTLALSRLTNIQGRDCGAAAVR